MTRKALEIKKMKANEKDGKFENKVVRYNEMICGKRNSCEIAKMDKKNNRKKNCRCYSFDLRKTSDSISQKHVGVGSTGRK